jgi:mycothiol synthase
MMEPAVRTDAAAATAAGIPDLVVRPYAGEADIAAMVRIRNADWEANGVPERWSVEDAVPYLSHPSEKFDPARDVRIAEMDGEPVAVTWSEWTDTNDGERHYFSRGYVVPGHRRRGIGGALVAANIEHLRSLAARHDTDRPKVLVLGTNQHSIAGPILAQRHGYAPVRWFFDMERPLAGDLPGVPPLPEGLEVRPVGPDDARRIWHADHDAFQDHWGGFDDSDAAFQRWIESPDFAPELFVVAFDGEEVAGAVLNAIYPDENEQLGVRRGWLDSVFTRRPWRRRGLAGALIIRSLHLLRQRGMERAVLGVDADNPSGALRLYESAGFAEVARTTVWQRPLEEAS